MTKGKKLAGILEEIRKHKVCAYMNTPCDCKFGADNIGRGHGESGNGCPEMRDAIHVVGNLTNREFDRLMKRKPARHFTGDYA